MALFTDGPIISTADLQKCENGIFSMASMEAIDLGGKIALAQDEIANQLIRFLLRRMPRRNVQWPAPRMRDLKDVVVTEPLRQWHVHQALAMVYRDAYNNQLNDRYQGKWTEYEQLAKTSFENYFRLGVGMVASPIAKASIPVLSTAAGIASAGTFYKAVAWVNILGQEGCLSAVAEITTSDGQIVTVAPVNPPVHATGWNAYVGISPETVSLQNSEPIGINSTWTMALGLQQGVAPGRGQVPSWFIVDDRVIQRG